MSTFVSVTQVQLAIISNSLRMEGFNVFDDIRPKADEYYKVLRKWAMEV